ncbi:MAG TPA: tetratricopeptide repeat protein [Longimicrobium sp.]|uniref:tetratricopeptide repeat protein n=1 Tax=Longimicrobium sp. TaxID=2029185 RepID=UPI002EDA394A
MLPALRDAGDDFAWAVWYAVWRVRDGEEPPGPAAAAERLDRFYAAIGAVPPLDEALGTLAGYLRGVETRPAAADALLRISEWALERGAGEPAIQCAEAAAALLPDSSRRALAAGRANRIMGEAARAAIHYERAMTMARMRRKWRSYVRAHLGLGHAKKALGDPAAARAHYYTAARAARSLSGEKWLAAQTRHDLMALASELGGFEEALTHARQALQWYPRHHARFPALAHDTGFLLVRMHLYAPALPLLQAVMRLPVPPQDQVIGWSTLARAAAGTGDAAAYQQAAENVLRRVGLFDLHAAAAFDNLAQGACLLALWKQAEQYASRSLEIAARGAPSDCRENASRALAHAREQRIPPHEPVVEARIAGPLLELARDMALALTVWRGATWKRKRQSGPERLGSV